MEDRDWYREKKIDWERGGLKERKTKKRVPIYVFWILGAVVTIFVVWLWRKL